MYSCCVFDKIKKTNKAKSLCLKIVLWSVIHINHTLFFFNFTMLEAYFYNELKALSKSLQLNFFNLLFRHFQNHPYFNYKKFYREHLLNSSIFLLILVFIFLLHQNISYSSIFYFICIRQSLKDEIIF